MDDALFAEDDGGLLITGDLNEDQEDQEELEGGEDDEEEEPEDPAAAPAPPPQLPHATPPARGTGADGLPGSAQRFAGANETLLGTLTPGPASGTPLPNGGSAAAKRTKADPNAVFSLTGCSDDMVRAYLDLESSVSAIVKAQEGQPDLSQLENTCLAKLESLNHVCDRLTRLVQRKRDILAVERALRGRNSEEEQMNPQDFVEVVTETLFQSRAGFQKVLL